MTENAAYDNTHDEPNYGQMEGFNYHNEITSSHVVTSQPLRYNGDSVVTNIRRPIPISVISAASSQSYILPANGLDFMRNANQLIIQQSVELTDLMANVSSENRYTVKIPGGENSEAIYYATESSASFQRTFCGSGRAFNMRLYDKTQQEAVSFQRRLACGTCTFWCYLQRMEVWVPPGEKVGTISQNIQFLKTSFEVCNRHGEVLYRIEGPNSFGCLLGKTQIFQIYTSDGLTQIGSIIHQWDRLSVSYNLLLQMPSSITDNRHKALLLGSAFLLEYMFFESAKKKTFLRCIC
ncbi:phospholipid scramblase family member 5-like isoform X2 [Cylas formicarius]|uniref:phospholipid scramblase family member 5-like isoform X2 n=1 Tax=Cylas formicarius TaxID=197179 RepID=UPI0029585880|nr:phospholipid scramblase family member 5-like isoform X2 [Cylas formicarius]